MNAASAGDTIEVRGGTYVENVDVGKRLTLIGEGADVVTVQAVDVWDPVLKVTTGYVNIYRFTVTGAIHDYGIDLNNADHCNISDNNASNNNVGIYLQGSGTVEFSSDRMKHSFQNLFNR